MITMRKSAISLFLFTAFATSAFAQAAKPLNVIKEGSGVEGIRVGKSTAKDVLKKLGPKPRREVNKKYSNQLTYDRLGLSFYYCQRDPKQTIFLIEVKSPYKGRTSRGVVLGKSTKEETEKIYGKPRNGFEYRGVNFYYNRYGRRNIITEIDVVENRGIRQCDDK